jgi:hypothetical protein
MVRRFMKRLGVAVSVTAVVLSLGAGAAFGGEITGNGKSLQMPYEDSKWGTGLHARSECAYSGQEDDQFVGDGSKGDPAHAQSWGQIPKSGPGFTRDFLTSIGAHPGIACNPTSGFEE